MPTRIDDLILWWLDTINRKKRDHEHVRRMCNNHISNDTIAALRLVDVKRHHIEDWLLRKGNHGTGTLGPQSCNHLRKTLHAAWEAALRHGIIEVPNPVRYVAKRRVPRHAFDDMTIEELREVIRRAVPAWRNAIAVAGFCGLRKGELLALRTTDVRRSDKGLTLLVARSWHEDTTKGGQPGWVPVAPECIPFIEDQLRRAQAKSTDLLFYGPGGRMFRPNVRPQEALRDAMVAAGIDEGRAKRFRWHDLRHTCASIMLSRGAPMHIVQRILRHSTVVLTETTYAHLKEDDVRKWL